MNTIDFLNNFRNENTKLEFITINNGVVKTINEEQAIIDRINNVYFLGGVDKELQYKDNQRAKDSDILYKNYFCLDLDIAKQFEEKYGEKISYEEIEKEGLNLIENLKYVDEFFAEFSFINISGGGLHIYYMGDFKQFTKEEYSLGVSRIYNQWDKIMGDSVWNCDKACKNLARILRLPGSINQKNGNECKILFGEKKESILFNLIKSFAIKEQEEIEKYKQLKEIEIKSQIKNFNKTENTFYDHINKIPAYQIAQLLVSEFPFDGKKNFDNHKGGFTGYYYVSETNTICNGGSRYFLFDGDESSCWNNFALVKHFKNLTDKETFLLFKNILGQK